MEERVGFSSKRISLSSYGGLAIRKTRVKLHGFGHIARLHNQTRQP